MDSSTITGGFTIGGVVIGGLRAVSTHPGFRIDGHLSR